MRVRHSATEDFAAHTALGSVAHGLVTSAADCCPAALADLALAVAAKFAEAGQSVAQVVEIVAEVGPGSGAAGPSFGPAVAPVAEPAPVLAAAVPAPVAVPAPSR